MVMVVMVVVLQVDLRLLRLPVKMQREDEGGIPVQVYVLKPF